MTYTVTRPNYQSKNTKLLKIINIKSIENKVLHFEQTIMDS